MTSEKLTPLEHVVATSTRKRPRTIRMYRAAVRGFLSYIGRDPSQYTGAAVEAWRDALVKSGLAPQTVNGRLSGVKFASKRLEALGLGVDFARAAEFLPVIFEKKRFAPKFEVGRQLVDACDGNSPLALRDRAMIILALRTGVRREGLAELVVADVEGNAAAITVVLKGGRRHKIHLDAESSAALMAWLQWLAAGPRKITSGHVFRSLRAGITKWIVGTRLHVSSINYIFGQRSVRAAVGNVHPHLARHAFISWADAAGVPRRRIAAVTGHLSLDSLAPYLSDPEAEDDPVGAHLPSLLGPGG